MLSRLRRIFRKNSFLRKLFGYHLASSGIFDRVIINYKISPSWQKRIDLVMSSPDNEYINHVADSGVIANGKQTMHNGLKIHLGSYYGPEYSKLLLVNRGVHEPQEERVFQEVLKTIPPNATMIEMGSFWSFYSMWFNQQIKGAKNFMIEPDRFNLGHGKRNFSLNKMKGTFIPAFVGKENKYENGIKTISVDGFVAEHTIPFVHMLHSDIQGFEYDMLEGAINSFKEKKIGYVFISTHSNDIHYKCEDFLKQQNFIIIASADLNKTFSEDGLIAARAPYFEGIDPVPISYV